MSVIVVGVDHIGASLEVLERVAVQGERLDLALDLLGKSDHITESVILSTCMRTEVYVDAVRFHPAVDDILEVLSHIADVDRVQLESQAFQLHEEDAFTHLFRVSAGLESAVLGESEVLGQVARSWDHARERGSCRSVLGTLFRRAVNAGKRARTETGISRGITSLGQAAVVMTQDALGSLSGKSILVVGAGEMGTSVAISFSRVEGLASISIVNRTIERAQTLASRVGGTAENIEALPRLLAEADVVVTSTGAPGYIIDTNCVESVMSTRSNRPLVMIDLAVPRDIDPEVSKIEQTVALDIEDVKTFTTRSHTERTREASAVAAIVGEEVHNYCADSSARLVAPVIAGLYELADQIRLDELDRMHNGFDPAHQEAIQILTKSMVNKLLHGPTTKLKANAGTPEGDRMAEALRVLFGI